MSRGDDSDCGLDNGTGKTINLWNHSEMYDLKRLGWKTGYSSCLQGFEPQVPSSYNPDGITNKGNPTGLSEILISQPARVNMTTGTELCRFLKFCSVGLTGVVINMGLLWFFTDFARLCYLLSSVIAIEASILSNFLLNDNWTFVDINTHSSVITRFLKLNAVYSIGMVINLGLLLVLTEKFGAYYLISNLFGIACATMFNFFWAKRYVWRPCT
jgi:putative flippase GtrA